MAQEPEITVIVTAYNRDKVLPRALNSVLAQTQSNFELIIVNDGSTDNTAAIANSYATRDARVHVIHKPNGGVATAWNAGVAAARAPWIALLDSDDMWLPQKLEKQHAFAQKLPPDTPACVTDLTMHDPDGRLRRTMRVSQLGDSSDLILKGLGIYQGSTMMIRREAYDHVGPYDPDLRRAQDWDWLLRYRQRYRLAIVPEILTRYSLGSKPSYEHRRDSFQIIANKHCHPGAGHQPNEIKAIRTNLLWHEAHNEITHRHPIKAGAAVAHFIVANPIAARQSMFRVAKRILKRALMPAIAHLPRAIRNHLTASEIDV